MASLENRFSGIARCIDANLRSGILLDSGATGGYFTAVGIDEAERLIEGIHQTAVGDVDPRVERWERLESRKTATALSKKTAETVLLEDYSGSSQFGGAAVKVPGAILSLWGLSAAESLGLLLFGVTVKEMPGCLGLLAAARSTLQWPATAEVIGVLANGVHQGEFRIIRG